MLIRRAEIADGEIVDVRLRGQRIAEIGAALSASPDEEIIEAAGAALLPGLHDHHIHLRALAASLASVRCGPPQVMDATALAVALRAADARLEPGTWLRGIAYHESVAGDIDRDWLDAAVADRPLRVQHRSGRLWILNSVALDLIAPNEQAPLERKAGRWTGRLYDADDWLRPRIKAQPPALQDASRLLARYGVTGVTDTTHHNDAATLQGFADAQARGELLQNLRAMGAATLDVCNETWQRVQRGEHKFHLHEHELPELSELVAAIRRSHEHDRCVAFHCVTRTELVFALAALREAGVRHGDRIEHAAIAPPELVEEIAALGLIVVTQPNFIAERGDAYLRDVAAEDQAWLYRLRGFVDAGVALALSTDAPFGEPNPWAAMQAAVTRRAPAGAVVAAQEALTPDQALRLFLPPLRSPASTARVIANGEAADLCLLVWQLAKALSDLSTVNVRMTLIGGSIAYRRAS
jgi:predicted amidohydrolase YtcJ